MRDLSESVSLLEESLDQTARTNRQLELTREEARNEIKRLQEDGASKTTRIKQLEDDLEESKKTADRTSEVLAHNVKLQELIQEKEEATRLAISDAADFARREVRFDLENEIDKVKKVQHQIQQQREALSEQVRKLNEEITRNEESKRNDAAMIDSLRETIKELEKRYKQVSQEKIARESQFEQAKAQDSERAETLKSEIATVKTEATKLKHQVDSQIAKARRFVDTLRQLAEQHGVSFSVLENLENLYEGTIDTDGMIPRIAQAVDVFIGSQMSSELTERDSSYSSSLFERNLSSFTNLKSLLSKARLADTLQSERNSVGSSNQQMVSNYKFAENGDDGFRLSHEARLLAEERRVVVRSPADFQLEPEPPTIHQEKTRRRQGPQPKSILKPMTRNMTAEFWSPVVPDAGSLSGPGHQNNSNTQVMSDAPTSAQQTHTPPDEAVNGSLQSTGPKSRKRPSESNAGPASSASRRKRGKKGDQNDSLAVDSQQSPSQDSISGGGFKENISMSGTVYAANVNGFLQAQSRGGGGEAHKNSDDSQTPRRVLRGRKNTSQAASGILGGGEETTRQSPAIQRQSNSRTYGTPKSTSSMLELEEESQNDSQSSYWPPKTDTQESFDFLNDGGQSRDNPLHV